MLFRSPHSRVDVRDLDSDFIAFSGHKMLGPAGTGVLSGKAEALERLNPIIVGGGAVERVTDAGYDLKVLPYRLEAGTPNVGGVLGLAAAVEYLQALGGEAILAHEALLAAVLSRELEGLPHMRVAHSLGGQRLAVAALIPTADWLLPDDLAGALSDQHGIVTRSGFHCAHPLLDSLDAPHGALRLSAYVYNSPEELRDACRALRGVLEAFGR